MKRAVWCCLTLIAVTMTSLPPVASQTLDLNLPDIGDPSRQYLSGSDEQRLGSAVLQQLRDQGAIVDDVQLSEYLAAVGQRIAAYADYTGHSYTFFMVDDLTINAFAAPGGYIGVNAGLLLATRDEDELAGVLAHEIAHVSQRHIARRFADTQRLNLPMAAALLASALLATADPAAGRAALTGTLAAGIQRQINFTRSNEQEADRIGGQLLTRAGYDPTALGDFFTRLERGAGSAQIPVFLRTHPLPSNRAADAQNRFGNRGRERRNDLNYQMAKARAEVLTTDNTLNLIHRYQRQLSGDDPALRYGYALALKQAGRYDEASDQIDTLRRRYPDNLALRVEQADLALAGGERDQAWRLFEQAEQLYGDDYTLAMHYGQALATQGDPRKAMALLQPHLQRRTDTAPLYTLYAQAAQRAGNIGAAHAALTEYYALTGDLDLAIEQAELGLSKTDVTPYQQAQLRARLRELQDRKARDEQRR